MKKKFYYVESINLYVNLSLVQSFQLVERVVMDYELGRQVNKIQCCISIGKNAYFCDESHYYQLAKILS